MKRISLLLLSTAFLRGALQQEYIPGWERIGWQNTVRQEKPKWDLWQEYQEKILKLDSLTRSQEFSVLENKTIADHYDLYDVLCTLSSDEQISLLNSALQKELFVLASFLLGRMPKDTQRDGVIDGAMLYAFQKGRPALIDFLLKYGAQLKPDYLPLAAQYGDIVHMTSLLDQGVSPNVFDCAPIANAIAHGHIDAITLLISRGALLDVIYPKMGSNPLLITALYWLRRHINRQLIFHVLLNEGASPLVVNAQKLTATQVAGMLDPLLGEMFTKYEVIARWWNADKAEIYKMLKRPLTDTRAQIQNILAALPIGTKQALLADAILKNMNFLVWFLLDHGTSALGFDREAWSYIERAQFNGNDNSVRMLQEHGADVRPWQWWQKDKEVIGKILKIPLCAIDGGPTRFMLKGMPLAQKNKLLSYAIEHDILFLVWFLLEHGADANGRDSTDWSYLDRASYNSSDDVVRMLVEHGADVNLPDENGYTILHHISGDGETENMSLIISKGAQVNAQDDAGDTPLHWAARNNHKDAVLLLLQNGANKNIANKQGQTAAALTIDSDIAKMLVFFDLG